MNTTHTSLAVEAAVHAKVAGLMRTIDAYAFDYAKDGKLAPMRLMVERELRAVLSRPLEVAAPVGDAPVLYQFRSQATGIEGAKWMPWEECDQRDHEILQNDPVRYGRRYETRALYTQPPTPQDAAPAVAGKWVPCTPGLLLAGVSCAETPRQPGGDTHSHDHFISHTSPAVVQPTPTQDGAELVVTKNEAGVIVAVTWQGPEGQIWDVVAESQPTPAKEQVAEDARITWPKENRVGRREDMSPDGTLIVGLDSDNDVYVEVSGERHGQWQSAVVEFCNGGGGGGQSSHTRAALINLMAAIEADNTEHPHKAFPPVILASEKAGSADGGGV